MRDGGLIFLRSTTRTGASCSAPFAAHHSLALVSAPSCGKCHDLELEAGVDKLCPTASPADLALTDEQMDQYRTPGARATLPRQVGDRNALAHEQQLLDVVMVAAVLTCSQRTVCRLADSGRMPQPIRVGRLVRWTLKSINGWIEKGCPTVRVVPKKA